MKTARRRSRELAVQAVYQSLINRTAAPEIAKNIREMSDFAKADEELFNKLFFGTQTNAADYIQKSARCSTGTKKTSTPSNAPFC